MFKQISLLSLTLTLASFGASPAFTLAQDAQTQQAVSSVGQAASWPVAVRRFWEERAAETVRINGELW